MVESLGSGVPIAEMSEDEYKAVVGSVQEDVEHEGQRGGPMSRLAAFFGYWRTLDGSNLRVGLRRGDTFVPANSPGAEIVRPGDRVSLVLRQLHLPHLPHARCVAQLTWEASHWFDDRKKAQVMHVTSCDASEAGTAAAVGLPIFVGLKVEEGIGLKISIYVTADKECQPILDLLGGAEIRKGLALAGRFNPVFAMTGPYIQAAVTGLVKMSRKNFKLATWSIGFGLADAPVPLAYGEYILLDGVIRTGRQQRQLAWPDLVWNEHEERPTYLGGAFAAPYMMVRVLRHTGAGAAEPATAEGRRPAAGARNRRPRA